jgi:arginase
MNPDFNKKIVVIDVPTEAGTHWLGQAKAPQAMRNVGLVKKLENLGYQVSNISALDEPKHWRPTDIVNGVRDEENTLDVMEKVAEAVSSEKGLEGIPIVLGGDCSIEPGVMYRLSSIHRHEKLGILYTDGDVDLSQPNTKPAVIEVTGILDSMVLTHLTKRPGGLQSMAKFAKPDGSPLITNENIVLFGFDPHELAPEH